MGEVRITEEDSNMLWNLLVFFILFIVIACTIIFIIIPRVVLFTTQLLLPLKAEWESLLIFLVIFAIWCAFFNRNTDESIETKTNVSRVHDSRTNNDEALVQGRYALQNLNSTVEPEPGSSSSGQSEETVQPNQKAVSTRPNIPLNRYFAPPMMKENKRVAKEQNVEIDCDDKNQSTVQPEQKSSGHTIGNSKRNIKHGRSTDDDDELFTMQDLGQGMEIFNNDYHESEQKTGSNPEPKYVSAGNQRSKVTHEQQFPNDDDDDKAFGMKDLGQRKERITTKKNKRKLYLVYLNSPSPIESMINTGASSSDYGSPTSILEPPPKPLDEVAPMVFEEIEKGILRVRSYRENLDEGTKSSPDVNEKAENFIRKGRARMSMERRNSLRLNRKRRTKVSMLSKELNDENGVKLTGAKEEMNAAESKKYDCFRTKTQAREDGFLQGESSSKYVHEDSVMSRKNVESRYHRQQRGEGIAIREPNSKYTQRNQDVMFGKGKTVAVGELNSSDSESEDDL